MSPRLRLASLTLEKYGPFADRSLSFRQGAALHLVLGRNEAGKSITLRALSDLFCGFPATIKAEDFRVARFKSGELRLGATLAHSDGRMLSFRRRSGRANTLVGASDGEPCDEALFREFAGQPERRDFETEFGLTAQALRSGGEGLLAAGGRLAETLAAGSAQLAVLNKVRASLQEEAAQLFLATGRARKLNDAVTRYQIAGKQLRESIVTGDALARAREVLQEAGARRAEVAARLNQIEHRLALLSRAQRTRGKLRERMDKQASLAAFADLPDVADTALAAWLAARDRAVVLTQDLALKEAQALALQQEAAALVPAPALVAQAAAIEGLREMLGAADKSSADLPRREEAARNGRERLQRAVEALGLADVDSLTEAMPPEIGLTRVRDVLRRRAALDEAQASAATRLEKAIAGRRLLDAAGQSTPEDPAHLLRAFDAFADLPAAARRLRDQSAELDEQNARLERDAQRLAPPLSSLDALLRLSLPALADIETAVREAAEAAESARALAREIETLTARIADDQKARILLALDGEASSPEELRAARRARDLIVDRLETLPPADQAARAQQIADLRRSIGESDRHADILLGGADRAAQLKALDHGLEQAHRELQALQDRRQDQSRRAATFAGGWAHLWSGCPFTPLAPERMREWRSKAAVLIERYEAMAIARTALAAARGEFAERAAGLAAFAPQADVQRVEGEAVSDFHARLRHALDALQTAWNDSRAHQASLASLAHEIESAEQELAARAERRAALEEDWREALATLGLPATATFAEAEDAVRIWTGALTDFRDYREDLRRAATIRQDIEAFETRAAELAAQFAPELAGETPRRIVEALTERVQAARRAAADLDRLGAAQTKAARDIEGFARERAAAQGVLDAAAETLSCAPEDLGGALDKLALRREWREGIAALDQELARVGDGLSPQALALEQEGEDFDSSPAEMAELAAQKALALEAIGPAAVEAEQAARLLAQLETGRDAPRHAVEKQEAAAELIETAREWLIRTGAARLAGLAMERHRQRNQDPVIARIAGLFARATGGDFSGTTIDYDEDDQPVLKGVRSNGERLSVEAMSEGTRDQLFLALRLALLDQRSAEPLPFVGDDLLASFDDTRTAHALDMLADFGTGRQTLLFTHHGHVADLARRQLGDRLDLIILD